MLEASASLGIRPRSVRVGGKGTKPTVTPTSVPSGGKGNLVGDDAGVKGKSGVVITLAPDKSIPPAVCSSELTPADDTRLSTSSSNVGLLSLTPLHPPSGDVGKVPTSAAMGVFQAPSLVGGIAGGSGENPPGLPSDVAPPVPSLTGLPPGGTSQQGPSVVTVTSSDTVSGIVTTAIQTPVCSPGTVPGIITGAPPTYWPGVTVTNQSIGDQSIGASHSYSLNGAAQRPIQVTQALNDRSQSVVAGHSIGLNGLQVSAGQPSQAYTVWSGTQQNSLGQGVYAGTQAVPQLPQPLLWQQGGGGAGGTVMGGQPIAYPGGAPMWGAPQGMAQWFPQQAFTGFGGPVQPGSAFNTLPWQWGQPAYVAGLPMVPTQGVTAAVSADDSGRAMGTSGHSGDPSPTGQVAGSDMVVSTQALSQTYSDSEEGGEDGGEADMDLAHTDSSGDEEDESVQVLPPLPQEEFVEGFPSDASEVLGRVASQLGLTYTKEVKEGQASLFSAGCSSQDSSKKPPALTLPATVGTKWKESRKESQATHKVKSHAKVLRVPDADYTRFFRVPAMERIVSRRLPTKAKAGPQSYSPFWEEELKSLDTRSRTLMRLASFTSTTSEHLSRRVAEDGDAESELAREARLLAAMTVSSMTAAMSLARRLTHLRRVNACSTLQSLYGSEVASALTDPEDEELEKPVSEEFLFGDAFCKVLEKQAGKIANEESLKKAEKAISKGNKDKKGGKAPSTFTPAASQPSKGKTQTAPKPSTTSTSTAGKRKGGRSGPSQPAKKFNNQKRTSRGGRQARS